MNTSLLGYLLEQEVINEAKTKTKFWPLPKACLTYAATKTNMGLGLSVGIMDDELEKLWKKYYHYLPNQYYVVYPELKRGAYQKADSNYRENFELFKKEGNYEVWRPKGSKYTDRDINFFNIKTKVWYTSYGWCVFKVPA